MLPKHSSADTDLLAELARCFSRFRTDGLRNIDAGAFERNLRARIGSIDPESEGYAADEVDRQRDLSVKFFWGHDHDFGKFRLDGRMGDRHIRLLADFCKLFPVQPADFSGARVFDIGCWTGGTTLLLQALGAAVVAIEEVKKYADTAAFLCQSFGLDNAEVRHTSLYQCNADAYRGQFDIVHFPGVIYHLSDPLLALRILFNSLRPDGTILVESMGIDVAEPYCRFDGSMLYGGGSAADLSRSGWNWFIPSPLALERMLREAGFEETQSVWHEPAGRVYAYGRKRREVGICKAGLSVPDIR